MKRIPDLQTQELSTGNGENAERTAAAAVVPLKTARPGIPAQTAPALIATETTPPVMPAKAGIQN